MTIGRRAPVALALCAALLGFLGRDTAAALPGAGAGGLSWPSDHVFPTFAAAEHFDVADIDRLPSDQKILFATLEGLVNRTRPRIFLLQHAPEGKTTWLDALGVAHSEVADPWRLLERYRSEVKGVVVYDPAVPASINVATTLAGLDDAVVASPDTAPRLTNEDRLPVLEDLRGRFSDDMAAYTWEVDKLWPRTTHRVLVGIGPREFAGFRDYPVAIKALAISLRVGVPEERALWDRIARQMPPSSPYVGWFDRERASGEIPGVWFLTERGLFNVAGDLFANLTAFSGVAAPSLARAQPAAPAEAPGAKIYVTFTQSDGDNLQYMQHRMRTVWDDPQRGHVPMNWTVQPLAADCAPVLLEYYRRTATPDDYFVAGPSGAGYAFVSQFPPDAYRAFAEQTARYFRRTGIRVAEVHNMLPGGPQAVPADKAATLVAAAKPLGVMTFIKGVEPKALVLGDGLVGATQVFVHDVAGAEQKIAQFSSGWDGHTPRFIAVYLDAWHMGPSDAAAIAGSLGPNYEVVRGDTFFELARQARPPGR